MPTEEKKQVIQIWGTVYSKTVLPQVVNVVVCNTLKGVSEEH